MNAHSHKYSESPHHKEKTMILKTGQEAPDFVLPSHLDQPVRLSDYRGKKNVVLAFFPMAWTPI